jgi:hypothetical protein
MKFIHLFFLYLLLQPAMVLHAAHTKTCADKKNPTRAERVLPIAIIAGTFAIAGTYQSYHRQELYNGVIAQTDCGTYWKKAQLIQNSKGFLEQGLPDIKRICPKIDYTVLCALQQQSFNDVNIRDLFNTLLVVDSEKYEAKLEELRKQNFTREQEKKAKQGQKAEQRNRNKY